MEPYLTGETRALFDAWHAASRKRFERVLTFTEMRKSVQALSSLYVGRRANLGTPGTLEGAGKRAAFALYFAPLHFLVVHHVVRDLGFDNVPIARLWDLGCGSGPAGAAWGAAARHRREDAGVIENGGERREPRVRASRRRVKVIGVDRSGFALEEAERTYRAFHLEGETLRIDFGAAGSEGSVFLRARSPGRKDARREGRSRTRPKGEAAHRGQDAVILAWAVNELSEAARGSLLDDLAALGGTGTSLLIIEAVARKGAPWWPRWERALANEALAVHSLEWRRTLDLPVWIARMDAASGLDHRELTARVLGIIA